MNGSDPLAQLRDIHTPSPVDWWPPAPGWWVLLLLALLLVIALGVWCLRWYRAGAYRREARSELVLAYQAWQQQGNDQAYLQAANSILKRTAITGYNDQRVQALNGARWCEFLDQQWTKPVDEGFRDGPLVSAIYSESVMSCDIAALHDLAERWVKAHRGTQC
jgi:hypothetical protein